MKLKKHAVALYSIILLAVSLFASAHILRGSDSVLGIWITGEGKGNIEIYKNGDKYFGKIVWLHEPNNPDGSPKKDLENPNKNLRNQTLIGLELLRGFSYEGDNEWVDGQIYDPESGNDYSCKLTLRKDGKLDVRGYLGISLFGRTDVWTRKK